MQEVQSSFELFRWVLILLFDCISQLLRLFHMFLIDILSQLAQNFSFILFITKIKTLR